MYFQYSHFVTADQIEEMDADVMGEGRKIASVIGKALAINRWIVDLTNCVEFESHKLVRWTYENGAVYIYYWGNIWGWRTLKRRIEDLPSRGVKVTRIIDWELASYPS